MGLSHIYPLTCTRSQLTIPPPTRPPFPVVANDEQHAHCKPHRHRRGHHARRARCRQGQGQHIPRALPCAAREQPASHEMHHSRYAPLPPSSPFSRLTLSLIAVLQILQEMLAGRLAGVPTKRVAKDAPLYERLAAKLGVDDRTFKMSLYGFFVSAPLSHFLTGYLQKAFAGKTNTLPGKLKQIATSALTVSPIMISGACSCCEGGVYMWLKSRSVSCVCCGHQRRNVCGRHHEIRQEGIQDRLHGTSTSRPPATSCMTLPPVFYVHHPREHLVRAILLAPRGQSNAQPNSHTRNPNIQ